MRQLELKLFGLPEFKLDGRSVDGAISSKGRALFAYLALSGRLHSRLELATMLWAEKGDADALRNLRVTLTGLKRVLGDYLHILGRRDLGINSDRPIWIDCVEFGRQTEESTPSLTQLETAVQLYQDHFFEGFHLRDAAPFDEWVWEQKERYRNHIMTALRQLTTHYHDMKQYSKGINAATRLIALEPWSEESHQQLMRLFALSGQRSAALAQFEQCRHLLEKELGVEPSEATTTIYLQILNEQLVADVAETAVLAPSLQAQAPRQAPPLPPHFVGRTALATSLLQNVANADEPTIQALVGMGGIGKSTTAIFIAQQAESQFQDGILWANMASGEPMAILERWAQAYGYDFSRIGDLENMAAAFRGVLADKSVLMVLDDVRSAARIRPLLPNGKQNHVLLTTRDHDLASSLNATIWPLRELSVNNGRLLLTKILGQQRINNEPDAAIALCEVLQQLPLAVEITAQRLKSRPQRRLVDVVQRLRDETQRLSMLEISDQAVRASFKISWESLDEAHRQVFALLGVFNGRSFTADAVAALTQLDRYRAEDRLYNLAALSLVREEKRHRFRQHSLLADFAREQLEEENLGEVNGRFAQHYLQFAQQHQTDYDALRPEWSNMMLAIEIAQQYELWQTTIDFAHALHNAWFTRGRYSQARQGYTWAKRAAEQLQHPQHSANILLQLGRACIEQGDYKQAKQHLQEAFAIYQTVEEISGIADVQYELARLAMHQSDYEAAIDLFHASQQLREQLLDKAGIAKTLEGQARIAYRKWEHHQAFTLGKEALRLQKEANNPLGTVQALRLLIDTILELHKRAVQSPDLAEEYGQQALNLAEQIQDQGEYAATLYGLSRVALAQGRFSDSMRYAKNSLSLFEKIGDRRTQALIMGHMAKIEDHQNNFKASINWVTDSLEILRQLDDNLEIAITLTNLGKWLSLTRAFKQAQTAWQEALLISNSLGHEKLNGILENNLQQVAIDIANEE